MYTLSTDVYTNDERKPFLNAYTRAHAISISVRSSFHQLHGAVFSLIWNTFSYTVCCYFRIQTDYAPH